MESNSSSNADANTRRHNEEVLKNLKPGDLIKIDRDLYMHWAVYIGKEEGVEKVIHWDTVNGTEFRKSFLVKAIWAFMEIEKFRKITHSDEAHIRTDSFWTVVGNSKAENGNNKDLENGEIDNSRIVEGAKDLKEKTEQGEICFQFYNSEHFANFCRYGQLSQITSSEGNSDVTDKSKLILVSDPTSTNDKDDDKIREHNTKLLDTLKIGDLIKFNRLFYYHWAVYIGRDDDTADAEPKVIHWWGPPEFKTSKKGASIKKTSFWEAARKSKAEKGNEIDLEKGTINGHRVAARAAAKQSLVEENLLTETYSLLFNNCEHFAKWCRYELDDDGKVQESPREHHRVVFEIEDERTRDHVSELSRIYRKWSNENLKGKEQVKLLATEVRNLTKYVSKVEDMEKRIRKRIYVEVIFIYVCITFVSLSGGRLGKIREALRLSKSKMSLN